jgi:hypothetical protein
MPSTAASPPSRQSAHKEREHALLFGVALLVLAFRLRGAPNHRRAAGGQRQIIEKLRRYLN